MPVDIRARVVGNAHLSPDYNVLTLAAPEIAATCQPGQFVMLKPGLGIDPLLRRPFSVFEVIRDGVGRPENITILSKRIGVTTTLLHQATEGDMVDCLGPLGRPFTLVDSPVEAWMVAGGVGLAPFATMLEALRARGVAVSLFYGARSAADLFYLDWFRDHGAQLVLATEDGSAGDQGRITLPLERELRAAADRALTLYACGPEPMLEAVSSLATRYNRRCEVSVERVMGCGMGGCYSCVVPLKDGHGGQCFVRSCLSGPVFDGAEIVWE